MPRRKHGLLQLDREPVLAPRRGVPVPVQRVTGLAHRPSAAAQFADVAQDRPHGDGAAVGAEHRFAHHVHGPYVVVRVHHTELPVDGTAVDQAAGDHLGQPRPVLVEHEGGQFVEGERGAAGSRPRIRYSSPDQLTSSVRRSHSALPTLLSREARGAAQTARVTPRRTRRARAAGPPAAAPGARPGRRAGASPGRTARDASAPGVPASAGVSRRTASTSPLSRRVCEMSASTGAPPGGRAAGRSAERGDGMTHSDAGRYGLRAGGETVTTVAQPATPCKGFGNTR